MSRVAWICLCACMVGASASGQGVRTKPDAGAHPPRIAKHATSLATAGFDATYYALDLRVDVDARRISGGTRVVGTAMQPLDDLVLDFDQALRVDSVLDASGQGLRYVHAGQSLSISLGSTHASGAMVDLHVYYQGEPASSGFGGFVFETLANGRPAVWTLSEPYGARTWWPSKDHPSDKADSVDISVEVPLGLTAGSNGLLSSREVMSDGFERFEWRHRYPIATYLVSLAIAEYDVSEQTYQRPPGLAAMHGELSLPLVHYSYAGNGAFEGNHPQFGFKYITEIFPILEDWFGAYPFAREKYGHAQFTFGGAMEHQTLSSMTSSYRGTMAHELAHQWFGDMISPAAWPHLWLNEGFATFGELAYWEESAFPEVHQQVFDIYYNRALLAEGTLVLQDTSDVSSMFAHSRVYSKGWMVLRMLRGMVGEETFREILKSYANDPRVQHASATTDDFHRVAEEVAGRPLGTFFRQWVTEGTGAPTYAARWGVRPLEGRYQIELTLEQVQSGTLPVFEMPIWIRVETESGPEEILVHNTHRVESFVIPTKGRPLSLQVDPDQWVLRSPEVVVTHSDDSPDLALPASLKVYPNPANSQINLTGAFVPAEVEIIDMTGRVLERLLVSPHETASIDVSHLARGVYGVRTQGPHPKTQLIVLSGQR